MIERIKGLRNKFLQWKETFERKGLNVSLRKTKAMVNGGITKDGLKKNGVDPCVVCSLRVRAISALCQLCGKWIQGICAGVKRVTPKFLRYLTCRKCEGNIREAVEQEEILIDEMHTVGGLTYLGDRVSAGGGCESAETARTRCGWVRIRERDELLNCRRSSLRLKDAVYERNVWPVMQYRSEAWCRKESYLRI